MKRYVNAWLDLAGLLLFGALLSTGLMTRYILPPGSGHGPEAKSVFGMSRHEWGGIHFWTALVFVAVVVVHIWLHWRWVWGVMTGSGGVARRAGGLLAGFGGVLVVIVLAVLPFVLPVDTGPERRDGEGHGHHGGRDEAAATVAHKDPDSHEAHGGTQQIRGSATLAEAAAMAGVTPGELAEALGTTEPVTGQERLGELREKHGWSMRDVRDTVQSLSKRR